MSETAKRFVTNEVASFEKYGSGEIGKVQMVNLSQSGARFVFQNSNLNFVKGDVVRFTLTLPKVQRVHTVNAEVVWSRDNQIGVSFIRAEEVLGRLIAKY